MYVTFSQTSKLSQFFLSFEIKLFNVASNKNNSDGKKKARQRLRK